MQDYKPVESQPIIVSARELGTNIPRSKVLNYADRNKCDFGLRRRETSKSTSSSTCVTSDNPNKSANYFLEELCDSESSQVVQTDEIAVEGKMDYIATSDTTSGGPYYSACNMEEMETTNTVVSTAEEIQTVEVTDIRLQSASPSSGKEHHYYFTPNEPVFTSTKKYSEKFVFWQVLIVDCTVFVILSLPSHSSFS